MRDRGEETNDEKCTTDRAKRPMVEAVWTFFVPLRVLRNASAIICHLLTSIF